MLHFCAWSFIFKSKWQWTVQPLKSNILQLTNKNLIKLIITLSFYDYELKIIAEMVKTNSIVLPFASKAALSATPIKGQNTKQTKNKNWNFHFLSICNFYLSCLGKECFRGIYIFTQLVICKNLSWINWQDSAEAMYSHHTK